MTNRPRITAEVAFLSTEDGGRQRPPVLDDGRYMPHIVIGSPDVRRAMIDPDGICREPYQGVRFVDGPSDYRLGHAAVVTLDLVYFPDNRYDDCVPGATFTIREGGKVVGSGRVLARFDGQPTSQ